MKTWKVTLREKAISNGRKSLYLDFYPAIVNPATGRTTRREYLGLYIYENPNGKAQRNHNKETRLLAEKVSIDRQEKIQKRRFDFLFPVDVTSVISMDMHHSLVAVKIREWEAAKLITPGQKDQIFRYEETKITKKL